MPLLLVRTNQPAPADREPLLARLSAEVAALLGKPERYVMVALETEVALMFSASSAPAAYLELKSIHLPTSATAEFSARLCGLMQELFGIPPARVYIEFANASGPLWGFNGSTF